MCDFATLRLLVDYWMPIGNRRNTKKIGGRVEKIRKQEKNEKKLRKNLEKGESLTYICSRVRLRDRKGDGDVRDGREMLSRKPRP